MLAHSRETGRIPHPWANRAFWVLLGVVLAAFSLRFREPPIGYLHSWNQITTLAQTDSISRDFRNILAPEDVVTRLSWEGELGESVKKNPRLRFVVYEEFPLYQTLAAAVGKAFGNLLSARLLSIVAFIITALGIFRLSAVCGQREHLSLFIFCSSFPYLFYGQAIMSDMWMAASITWFYVYAERWMRSQAAKDLGLMIGFSLLGSLFKSYGLIFVLCIPVIVCLGVSGGKAGRLARLRGFALGVLILALASAPIICWHFFTLGLEGHHETVSHSLSAKLEALSSMELYKNLWKMLFRYLGYLPGALCLLCLLFPRCRKALGCKEMGNWLNLWMWMSMLYLLFTLDKLTAHDYYFLPVFVPLVVLAADFAMGLFRLLELRGHRVILGLSFALVFLLNPFLGFRAFFKATRPNPDVVQCAEAIRSRGTDSMLIATLTDVSRFNSLAYLSGMRAINVEGNDVPLCQYQSRGAKLLVLNLAADDYEKAQTWVRSQLGKAPEHSLRDLVDFRGRPRVCSIWTM